MMNDVDREIAVEEYIKGRTLAAIARTLDTGINEVREIIDAEASRAFSATELRRDAFKTTARLKRGEDAFYEPMVAGDATAAKVYEILVARRQQIINPAAQVVITQVEPDKLTSTQRIEAVMNRLCFDPAPPKNDEG